MTKSILQFILMMVLLVSVTHVSAQKLSAQDFSEKIKTDTEAVVLDVRTPQEFEGGHINDAINIDFKNSNFANRTDSLDKQKPLYVYCMSGGRSAKAVAQLRSKGFTVYELSGGMLNWRAAGLPEDKPYNKDEGIGLNEYAAMIKSYPKVLIDFYAEWCAPCKLMEPHITKLQQSEKEDVKVYRIDIDKNPRLAKDLKIDALPVVHYYKDGDMKWGHVGYLSKRALRKKMRD